MMLTITDRLRIPWCTGKGALHVPADVAVPMIAVPLALVLGTINIYFTAIMLTLMPLGILTFYQLWTRRQKKERTKLFYVWGLTSAHLIFYIFEIVVVPFREILLWENLAIITAFGLTMYALFLARKDPGIVRRERYYSNSLDPPSGKHQNGTVANGSAVINMTEERGESGDEAYGSVVNFLAKTLGFEQDGKDNGRNEKSEFLERMNVETVYAKDVFWVDSRSIEGESNRLTHFIQDTLEEYLIFQRTT